MKAEKQSNIPEKREKKKKKSKRRKC